MSVSGLIPEQYTVFRKDRASRQRAGGVLVAVLSQLQPHRLPKLEASAEIIWFEVQVSGKCKKLLIGCAYRRPENDASYNNELLNSLKLASRNRLRYDGCLLTGDFNLNVDWKNKPPMPCNTLAKDYLKAFDNLSLEQFITEPTRTTSKSANTIDLFFCDNPDLIECAKVVPGLSDHDALWVTLSMQYAQV